jgi:hypothetical protein
MENNEIVKEGYILVKQDVKSGVYKVTIEADSNDGDYIATNETYEKEEFEKEKLPLLMEMFLNHSGRHEFERLPGYISEQLDIPHGEMGPCHTLNSLDITYISENGMYNLEFDKEELQKCFWKYVLQRYITDIEKWQYAIEDILEDEYLEEVHESYEDLKSMSKEEISVKYSKNNIDKILFGLLDYIEKSEIEAE